MLAIAFVLVVLFDKTFTECKTDNDKKICVTEDVLRVITKLQSDKDNDVKPAFFASLKAHPYTLSGENDVIKFDEVRINRGGGYSPSSGYFTAPRKGIYHFSCMLLAADGNLIRFQINKNAELFTYGHVARGENDSQTITSLIEMDKGDRVFIKHRTTDVQSVYGHHHSTFYGYFIQE